MKMKKFFVFLLSLSICFTPSLVFAGGLGGWYLNNPIAQGASTLYNGAKNVIINGKNVAKTSTALITPTVTQVAKVLARGAAGYALSVAVEELLGAVDWVLDPANNQIKYKIATPSDPNDPTLQYYYQIAGIKGTSAVDVCQKYFDAGAYKQNGYTGINASAIAQNPEYCYAIKPGYSDKMQIGTISKVVNPNYDPSAENENNEKTIPLDVVAQKVISNAESGDTNAQAATTAAAADVVSEAEKDDAKARPIVNQLEANAKTETDEGANDATGQSKPNTETGGTDLSLEFPTFCGWAPQVCEAAQTVISFPTTLTDWWNTSKQKTDSWASSISEAYTETKEWFQKEPEKDSEGTDVDVEIPEPFDTSVFSKDRFAVSRQCPVPEQHTISLSGVSVNFSFDMTPLCQVLILARPALVACSYLYAAYIVIGAARNG